MDVINTIRRYQRLDVNLYDTFQRSDRPIVWFKEEPPEKALYRVYNDGGHYVAKWIDYVKTELRPRHRVVQHSAKDKIFDYHYIEGLQSGLRKIALENYLADNLESHCSEGENVFEYVRKRIKGKYHNLHARKKRFKRKAVLNKWNYFVHFTYDDDKVNETEFARKLRKCLSNLHTRHRWRYMGAFERAPETGRLHFHGIFYIPEGEMISQLYLKRDYSTTKHCMQEIHCNKHFERRFGRNDFEELDEMAIKQGDVIDYILKYIGKSNEKIFYSRGIKDSICVELNVRDLACEMQGYFRRYVVFDDVISWETHVMDVPHTQISLFDRLLA